MNPHKRKKLFRAELAKTSQESIEAKPSAVVEKIVEVKQEIPVAEVLEQVQAPVVEEVKAEEIKPEEKVVSKKKKATSLT